ncbi:MAG TPA: PadR family transcriptional regulator [Sphingomonas sp.]|jgi:DNA-binding PadR family transcriptional regulator
MSLAHALLTALAERSCSGSELARRFDRSIGYFWPASHQQIYRELSRLESEGWVTSEPIAAAPGRRRVYDLLPDGREELRRWVAEPREPKAIRDELLVKLRAEAVLGGKGLVETLRLRLDRHQAKITTYRTIAARSFANTEPSREQRLQRLILNAGIDLETLWIALCEEALVILADEP